MPPRVSVCLGEGSRSLSLLLFPGRSTRWRAWALVSLRGGALNGVRLDAPGTVAGLARTAQFGELLDFDRTSNLVDGVLRTSVRGWYTFAHLCFGLLFLFGHWWHASRTLYRDLLSGLETVPRCLPWGTALSGLLKGLAGPVLPSPTEVSAACLKQGNEGVAHRGVSGLS